METETLSMILTLREKVLEVIRLNKQASPMWSPDRLGIQKKGMFALATNNKGQLCFEIRWSVALGPREMKWSDGYLHKNKKQRKTIDRYFEMIFSKFKELKSALENEFNGLLLKKSCDLKIEINYVRGGSPSFNFVLWPVRASEVLEERIIKEYRELKLKGHKLPELTDYLSGKTREESAGEYRPADISSIIKQAEKLRKEIAERFGFGREQYEFCLKLGHWDYRRSSYSGYKD